MKKFLSLLMALTMLMACTACFGSAESASDPAAYDGSEVNITFYNTMGSNLTPVLDTYIEEFNKLYPNIHVSYTSVGGYDDVRDQISKEITVGGQPNIAYCYPDHVALYNLARAVQPLDAYIDSTATITRADGTTETFGLTQEQKDDFDANGLTPPTTWDEMEALCNKIVEIDPYSIPLGYDSENNWFITMTEQLKTPYTSATGEHFLFNTPENRAFVKRFATWYNQGLVTTQTIYGSYTSGLFVSDSGIKSYMSIGSSAGATHQRPTKGADGNYPFEVGITTIPQVDASNAKVISQGPSLCIFKKSNAQEVAASWLFVKYLTTTVDFQAEFSMASGYVPVIKSVANNEVYADFVAGADGGDNVAALAAKVCLEQVDAYYTSPAFPGSSEARSRVGELMAGCMTDAAALGDLTKPENDAKLDELIQKRFDEAITKCEQSIAGFGI